MERLRNEQYESSLIMEKCHGIQSIEALEVVIVDLENGGIEGVMGRF